MMEHYEIVDVMNRQQHPRIELDFKFEKNRNNNTPRNDLYDLEIRMETRAVCTLNLLWHA